MPIIGKLETDLEITVECQFDDEKKLFMLALSTSMSDTTGYEKRWYKKRYSYQVPKLQTYKVKCSGIGVPEGKTLLIHSPFPKYLGEGHTFKSDKWPENIILLKPVIVPEKGADSGSGGL